MMVTHAQTLLCDLSLSEDFWEKGLFMNKS